MLTKALVAGMTIVGADFRDGKVLQDLLHEVDRDLAAPHMEVIRASDKCSESDCAFTLRVLGSSTSVRVQSAQDGGMWIFHQRA